MRCACATDATGTVMFGGALGTVSSLATMTGGALRSSTGAYDGGMVRGRADALLVAFDRGRRQLVELERIAERRVQRVEVDGLRAVLHRGRSHGSMPARGRSASAEAWFGPGAPPEIGVLSPFSHLRGKA